MEGPRSQRRRARARRRSRPSWLDKLDTCQKNLGPFWTSAIPLLLNWSPGGHLGSSLHVPPHPGAADERALALSRVGLAC